jgi:hypothetical protein
MITLVDLDLDGALAVGGGGEDLRLLGGNGNVVVIDGLKNIVTIVRKYVENDVVRTVAQ